MTIDQKQEKYRRLTEAMIPLVGDTRFIEFMEVVKDYKELAVENSLLDATIANERLTLASLGEVRAYKDIIGIYENNLEIVLSNSQNLIDTETQSQQ